MKDYLKENISFNKLLFSTSFTTVVIVLGSLIGYLITEENQGKYLFHFLFV